nr:hypothetical protein [Tanacetum cinerariifolium]
MAGDHRKLQLNKLNELRNQAYENSLTYKENTKKLHDSNIKNRIFNIVEVSNGGLICILERTVGENRALWSEKLEDALWAFRTAYKTPIGCTPYMLVYGKSRHLPIELEHKAYWALKHIFLGKLKTRSSGPFTITKVFSYGTVELSQPEGPNFKVNGHHVKHYFGGDIPQLVVSDLQTFPMDK